MNVTWKVESAEVRGFTDPDGTAKETMTVSAAVLVDGAPVGGVAVTLPAGSNQGLVRAAIVAEVARFREERLKHHDATSALVGLEGDG